MGKTIAVLFHRNTRPENVKYYWIHQIAEFWRQDGHKVHFLFGTRKFVEADLILVHVDLTIVPREYLEFSNRYPVALNAEVKDIRKSTYSQLRVLPEDDYEGPVIVKSNLNYGGVPELMLRYSSRLWQSRHVQNLFRSFCSSQKNLFKNPDEYPIFQRKEDVPDKYFEDENLIIERFLPERKGAMYYVRAYLFLGDGYMCEHRGASRPIVRASNDESVDPLEPHEEIVAIRKRMNIQYGKIDYVIHQEKSLLLDINKTIGAGRPVPETVFHEFAASIYTYLS